MTQTFTWVPDAKVSGTTNMRVLKAQFGDGYAQSAADGINNAVDSWPVVFTEDQAIITAIRDFLASCKGYQSFYWTPPLGVQGYYKCPTYTVQQVNGSIWQLSATFNQSFQP